MLQRIGWGWALFVLASCSSFETAPPPPDCLRNIDCTNGRICAAGSCVAACRLDSECAEGERCVFSRCQPSPADPVDASLSSTDAALDMASADMAAPADMQAPDMSSDMHVADMASDMQPPDMAATDMVPADMAADMAPADMAADAAPDMAPAADMAP